MAFVGAFDPGLLRVAKKLRWVHSGSGGVEGYMFPQLVESPITLTCSKPCFDSTGAEYALGMMLAFSRRLHVDLRHGRTGSGNGRFRGPCALKANGPPS